MNEINNLSCINLTLWPIIVVTVSFQRSKSISIFYCAHVQKGSSGGFH